MILLAGVRVTNLFVPILYKDIVDALVETELRPSTWPWQYVTIWAVLRLLQGGGTGSSGLLNNWRSLLWIRVQQYTTLEIQTNLLAHVHNLSLRWHLGRKTGELTRVMDRGTSAVNNLLQYLVFNILPTLIDIIIAVIYFCIQFNVYFGLIVLLTMVLYLLFTFAITEWRTKYRREMNELDNKQRARGVDSLLNAETVKYYSMEDYEVQRYKELIQDCQAMEWKSMATLQFLNLIQSLIINSGLFGVSLYCAYLVTNKELTVGDFTLVGTYFMQLMSPLNFIGTVYRMIQESFINMEDMFDLLHEKIEVQDKPDAITYKQNNHPPELQFKDVSFHYTESRPILENLSFVITPGSSVAVVGASGNGKSTLAKIMFRLFDPVKGTVLINGRDIKDYTQKSYRGNIGVVPQDTVLFNESIMYNLSYGKIGVTQAEIENAAKMADIHSTILDFPEGYKTVVGERGLKLSGGEKQRVAIARALIKNPNIIIFDEATSSLDTKTELHIQNAIESASKQRTVLMIAHRLSTVMNCDQIIVLDEGRIAERGTHEELIQLDGKYANLWNIQISAVNSKECHTGENQSAGDEGGIDTTRKVCNGTASKIQANTDVNLHKSNNVLANEIENSHVENTVNELDMEKHCVSTEKINEQDEIRKSNGTVEKENENMGTVAINENIDNTVTEDHDEISEDTKLLSSSPKVSVTKSAK